jgi:hypothetical protein
MMALGLSKSLAKPTHKTIQVPIGTKKPIFRFLVAGSSLANQSYKCGADF